MTPTTPRTVRPVLRRAAILGLLLASTLAFAAAARRLVAPAPTPPRVASGSSAVAIAAGPDRSAVLHGGDGLVRVELALRGGQGAAPGAARVPTDLVVVLDRSGSMAGEPLATALAALRELCAGLADGDRFALVSYASDARIDVPLETASAAARERWERAIAAIGADGGTAMSSGLDLGHGVLAGAARPGAVGRLIVLSDGHANQGDYSLDGLRARAGRARPGQYVLSAVGIGNGFDESVMSALADAGTGNFYYLPDTARLRDVFAGEFAAARETVARALAVTLTPGAGVRVAGAGDSPLAQAGDAVVFHPGDLFAGQERRVWVTLHVPTGAVGDVALGGVAVAFTGTDGAREQVQLAALPAIACVENGSDYYASFDTERYERANRTDSLGDLKQRVARKVAAGRRAEAAAEIEAHHAIRQVERDQLRALGYAGDGQAQELDELRSQVSAPAVASPEARSRLGKELLERGRDDQRAGAKKK